MLSKLWHLLQRKDSQPGADGTAPSGILLTRTGALAGVCSHTCRMGTVTVPRGTNAQLTFAASTCSVLDSPLAFLFIFSGMEWDDLALATWCLILSSAPHG